MTDLNEFQFEIVPDAEAMDGFVFGIGSRVSTNDGGFDPGANNWLTQDSQNSRRGVTGFGRDVLGGKTWVWESHANGDDEYDAVDILQDFSAAWMPDVREPGKLQAIRYTLAGRTRRIFGRPRNYSAPPTNQILQGYTDVTHDFNTVDTFTYDDEMSEANFPFYAGGSGGGFVLPAVMPLTSSPGSVGGGGQVTIGGNANCYPIIRFNGPWTNPSLDTGDWAISWTGSIPTGGWVEIDTRPWMLTVLNQSGASVVGGFGRQAYLEDCWFAPGSQPNLDLNGSAASGAAGLTIKWRNAWTSL